VVEGVRISHPNRVVFAGQSVTKVELAEYFASIQDWVLPYLANRLLSLVRCPEGALTGCFYQKHLPRSQASGVPRRPFRERKGPKPYVFVQKIAHVVALVQAGVLEFHVFGSQVADLEHPDLMVFDLDPSPGVAWAEVLRVARALRQRLDDLGLVPFVRLTGGKGVHVVVPLAASTDWDGVKAFAKAVANQLAREDPRRLTAALSKRRRRGKIFIDYLRNSRGATAVACYSPRARPGAPVAVPIRWDELSRAEGGDHYSVVSLPRRLRALRANPWEGFYDSRRPILPAMMRAVGLG
jgi:bifunctional non-homologous end joining protein LigD